MISAPALFILLFQSSSSSVPICGPMANAPNGLCQDRPQWNPTAEGTGTNITPDVVVLLEDGGRPASRPDIQYVNCGAGRSGETCHAVITLKGFREVRSPLNSRIKNVVVLQRLGAEGDVYRKDSVSLSQIAIPPDAHKSYAKGIAAAGQEKWADAERFLRQATQSAPVFALAWDELGWALERQAKLDAALEAYRKAAAADPALVRPYVHLAGIAVVARDWETAAALAGAALRTTPSNYPRAYFYHALAHYNLKHYAVAEGSARQAIAADPQHAFPLAEYMLGMSLVRTNNAAAGREHLEAYLKFEPDGQFAGEARRTLAELQTAAGSN
jgi:tetratricopeptide (TPR) repeat protein